MLDYSFSLVFITYRPGGIDILTKSLASQTYQNFDLIVVDDYKERDFDAVRKYMQGYGITPTYLGPSKPKKFPETKYGESNALNTGLQYSKGDIILLIQDYAWFPKHALEQWNTKFNETFPHSVIVGGAKMCDYPAPDDYHANISAWTKDPPTENKLRQAPGFMWIPEVIEICYTGIPRSLLDLTGGFDETCDNGIGLSHKWLLKTATENGYKVIVDRENICYMVNHRTWDTMPEKESWLWHITRK